MSRDCMGGDCMGGLTAGASHTKSGSKIRSQASQGSF
jgi:hypothetical protein